MKRSFIRAVISATFLIGLLLAGKIEAQATIRRVPADYPTIQQAINASVDGDTVLVAPGTYVENINFIGKAVIVASEAGRDVTVIDGNRVASVVRFNSGEGRSAILTGFTLRNGFASCAQLSDGGGIQIFASSPSILHNVITSNNACGGGAGIAVLFGSPIIQDNIITNNNRDSRNGSGGGIYVAGISHAATPTEILDNVISFNVSNLGGGINVFVSGPITIRGNVIKENTAFGVGQNMGFGGGIDIGNHSPILLVQNLIVSNQANKGGGIYWSNPPRVLVNNTIAENDSSQGSGIFAGGSADPPQLVNNIVSAKTGQVAFFCDDFFNPALPPILKKNNIFSPQGMAYGGICPDQTGTNGNISADPRFFNPSAGDYHLRPDSPSIDTGDNTGPNLPAADLDGNLRIQDGNGDGIAVVDMGAYEAEGLPPFDICIQDDIGGSILRINSITGDYQFTNCSGFSLSGTGGLVKRGGLVTLQHYAADRRVLARIDSSVSRATASVQLLSPSTTFTITDRNTANNTCACAPH